MRNVLWRLAASRMGVDCHKVTLEKFMTELDGTRSDELAEWPVDGLESIKTCPFARAPSQAGECYH